MISSMPAATHSSTISWMLGVSTIGSISFGIAFVAGRNRVPRPATGSTALRTFLRWPWLMDSPFYARRHPIPVGRNEALAVLVSVLVDVLVLVLDEFIAYTARRISATAS